MLPSVVCRLSARTPLTTADVVTTEDAETPAALSTPRTAKMYARPTMMSLVMRDEGDADGGKQEVEDEEARELDARERREDAGDELAYSVHVAMAGARR